jgi:hypothetical protein
LAATIVAAAEKAQYYGGYGGGYDYGYYRPRYSYRPYYGGYGYGGY